MSRRLVGEHGAMVGVMPFVRAPLLLVRGVNNPIVDIVFKLMHVIEVASHRLLDNNTD